ncbi:MAG: macro domain-containing protein [Lachnospiraceae bacterium]|nr:macro domain-containing protein [Lachnospiraceae bacterium]
MPFRIVRNDITRVRADAVVNTANPEPDYGRGTDYAIYRAAGAAELLEARRRIGFIEPGEAAVTPAFALHADFIIHTVGPVWAGGTDGEAEILSSCYRKSLLLAEQLGCRSVAFPLISAGVYGFPKDLALKIATEEIGAFLEVHDLEVILAVFNKEVFELSSALTGDVQQYITDHYVEERVEEEYRDYGAAPSSGAARPDSAAPPLEKRRRSGLFGHFGRTEKAKKAEAPAGVLEEAPMPSAPAYSMPTAPEPAGSPPPAPHAMNTAASPMIGSLPEIMERLGESFQERLLHLIDDRGMTDTEVYKRANIDRKLFSKIRCNPAYNPTKRTAVALAVALRLNLDETVDLLSRAGIALSPSSPFDLIVEYCIMNRIYDIYEINLLLFRYDQPILGS